MRGNSPTPRTTKRRRRDDVTPASPGQNWESPAAGLADMDIVDIPSTHNPMSVAPAREVAPSARQPQGRDSLLPVFLFLTPALNWPALKAGLLQGMQSGDFTRFRYLRRPRSQSTVWKGKIKNAQWDNMNRLVARLWKGSVLTRDHIDNWQIPARVRTSADYRQNANRAAFSGKIVTWNIATLTGKRGIVQHFLAKEDIAVLGLQETQRTVSQYPLKIRDYTVLEQVAPHPVGKAQRGLALILKASLGASQVGTAHPNFMFARVPQQHGHPGWIIGNVYLPGKHTGNRQTTMNSLNDALRRLHKQFSHHRFVMMGDFNGNRATVLNSLKGGFYSPVDFDGSDKTWHGLRKRVSWTCIDYFVVGDSARAEVTRCKVLRAWDDSDHWPVQLRVKLATAPIKSSMTGLGKKRRKPLTPEQQELFKSDESWSKLLQLRLKGSLPDENFGDEVIRTAQQVTESCKKSELDSESRFGGRMLSREEKRIILKKQQAFRVWIQCDDSDLGRKEVAKAEWRVAQKEFKTLHREFGQKRWVAFIQKGAEGIAEKDMTKTWRFARSITGRTRQPNVLGAIKDASGRIQYDSAGILEAWKAHYSTLGDDSSIRELDESYWRRLLRPQRKRSLLDSLNREITRDEMTETLKALKSNKAPGLSGIPVDTYKLTCDEPDSEFTTVLLDFCNTVFRQGPSPKMSESVIVSIYKDDDRHDPSNYRGISLMDTALKIVCTVLARRLSTALESKHRLIREQGGFRSLEECVAQAGALMEILERRKTENLDTWVAFVDFKKAFDLVPHEGLFAKLWKIGVRGLALHFIKRLYALSSARARAGSSDSDAFPVRRGVRQGCPLSPILFLIFINDIYHDERERLGVSVPTSYGQMARRCPGLLFADDEVSVAEDPAQLQDSLRILHEWAKKNAMVFGIQKCGIMAVPGRTHSTSPEHIFTLGGCPVPNVAEYKYLGIVISSDLSMKPHLDRRNDKGITVLQSLRPVFGDWSVPLQIRKMLVKSLLIPVLTYGIELSGIGPRGGSASVVLPLERCLATALRMLIRGGTKSSCYDTLLKEFGFSRLEDMGKVRRIRLFLKYQSLTKTWISLMLRRIESSKGRRTWINATKDLMANYKDQLEDAWKMTPALKRKLTAQFEGERENKRRRTASTTVSYRLNSGFAIGPNLDRISSIQEARFGLNVLIKMRCGAFFSSFRKSHFIREEQLEKVCPLCFDSVPETIHHLLVECIRWEEERSSSGLEALIGRIRPMMTKHANCASDVFGEDYVGIDSQQPGMGVQLLGGQLLGLLIEKDSVDGPEESSRDIFEPVCHFLGLIYRRRLNWTMGKGQND